MAISNLFNWTRIPDIIFIRMVDLDKVNWEIVYLDKYNRINSVFNIIRRYIEVYKDKLSMKSLIKIQNIIQEEIKKRDNKR